MLQQIIGQSEAMMLPQNELEWDSLVESMLKIFPQLKDEYERSHYGLTDWHPSQYVVFGDIFKDFIRVNETSSSEIRYSIASFVEQMALSKSENMEDLLKIEVLPTFLSNQAMVDAYWPYLGSKARWLLDLVAPLIAPDISLPKAH